VPNHIPQCLPRQKVVVRPLIPRIPAPVRPRVVMPRFVIPVRNHAPVVIRNILLQADDYKTDSKIVENACL
jgi:hypothetical protein